MKSKKRNLVACQFANTRTDQTRLTDLFERRSKMFSRVLDASKIDELDQLVTGMEQL